MTLIVAAQLPGGLLQFFQMLASSGCQRILFITNGELPLPDPDTIYGLQEQVGADGEFYVFWLSRTMRIRIDKLQGEISCIFDSGYLFGLTPPR